MSRACRAAALGLAVLAAPALAGADLAPPPRVHEVARGDTLVGLAKRYGATVGAFVSANQLRGPDAPLTPGQRLVIPAPPTRPPVSKTRAPAKGLATPAMARPAPPAGPRPPASFVLAMRHLRRSGPPIAGVPPPSGTARLLPQRGNPDADEFFR